MQARETEEAKTEHGEVLSGWGCVRGLWNTVEQYRRVGRRDSIQEGLQARPRAASGSGLC